MWLWHGMNMAIYFKIFCCVSNHLCGRFELILLVPAVSRLFLFVKRHRVFGFKIRTLSMDAVSDFLWRGNPGMTNSAQSIKLEQVDSTLLQLATFVLTLISFPCRLVSSDGPLLSKFRENESHTPLHLDGSLISDRLGQLGHCPQQEIQGRPNNQEGRLLYPSRKVQTMQARKSRGSTGRVA